MKKLLVVFASLLLVAASCKEDTKETEEPRNGTFEVSVKLYNGTEEVTIGDTLSMTDDYDFYISLFRLYLAEIQLRSADGAETVSSIELVDPAGAANSFSASVPSGSYSSFELGYGVDAVQNDMNPGSFPNEHPLSSYQSMYWSMLKYRFAKFEGFAYSRTVDSLTNIGVAYHPGTDPLYEKRSYDVNINIEDGSTSGLIMKMDINDLLDGPGGKIDLGLEPQTHSEPSDIHIAQKFMVNLAEAVTIEAKN